jgi:ribosomal-protein-alanine N-acetyltransferase
MSYQIRQMLEKDISDIMTIEAVSFGTHHWTRESFKSELRNKTGNYYIVKDVEINKVVGYGGFWLIMDEAHVTTIAIHPNYRRKHLGELLLQQLIDRCTEKQAKWITLEVRVSNIGAQNLYFKYGFSSLGVRRKYYQDNDEDALIMWTQDIHTPAFQNLCKKFKEELANIIDKEVVYG